MKTLLAAFLIHFPFLSFAVCSSPAGVAGQMMWIVADLKVKFCNGSNWIDTSQSTGASCGGTTAGTINYASNTLRYCNGTNWINMNSGTSMGSCAGTTPGTYTWDSGTSKMKVCSVTTWYDLTYTAPSAPTALSLSQTSNARNFTVSWTSGSGNGGAGGCRLEFEKDGTTWTALAGTYNCDATAGGAAAWFPATTGWSTIFNGTRVRLARVSDGVSMGIFPQTAACSVIANSFTSTPDIDENCDRNWDDTTLVGSWTNASTGTVGAAYTCPSIPGGYTYSRTTFNVCTGITFYSDSGCTVIHTGSGWSCPTVFTSSPPGTVPSTTTTNGPTNITLGTCQYHEPGVWLKYTPARTAWDQFQCEGVRTVYR